MPTRNAPGSLRVGGLLPLTTIDYPGELAAVVFCQGCPWRCRYCHNGHLLDSRTPSRIAWEEVIGFLQRRRGLLDAVVFSGGEPTAQHALPDAVDQVRAMGFKVGLHTAGNYPDPFARLLPRLDWIGLDIKALPQDYPDLTGVPGSGEKAWASLNLLLCNRVPFDVRITIENSLLPEENLQRLVGRLLELGVTESQLKLQLCQVQHALDPALAAA